MVSGFAVLIIGSSCIRFELHQLLLHRIFFFFFWLVDWVFFLCNIEIFCLLHYLLLLLPFKHLGHEAVESLHLVLLLLEKLSSIGYLVCNAIDIWRHDADKSMLFFKRTTPFRAKFFCLAVCTKDRLKLINAPMDIVQASDICHYIDFQLLKKIGFGNRLKDASHK